MQMEVFGAIQAVHKGIESSLLLLSCSVDHTLSIQDQCNCLEIAITEAYDFPPLVSNIFLRAMTHER